MTNPHDKQSAVSSEEIRRDWPLWLLMAGLFVATIILYPQLPAEIPNHWNLRGEIDGYMVKPWGAFLLPLVAVGMYLLLLVIPAIDPRRENYARFAGTYRLFRWLFVLFMGVMHVIVLSVSLGYTVSMNRLMLLAMGLLFGLIGNSLGKVKHNYFVGIRTPWTLANEEVWRVTHRLAGKLWTAAGAITVIAAFLPTWLGFTVGIGALLVSTIWSTVYSYLAWRRLQ